MALSRSRLLYIVAVLVSGVVIGLLVLQQPHLRQAGITPAAWPLAVSLVLDLAIGHLAAQGKTEPLTMGDRFVAVLGAGLIITAMLAWG
jgi:hypothetical protein